ncbi:MAG: hypothetical protein RLZZ522_367, partial [Verrucomicrobiota bacterium]
YLLSSHPPIAMTPLLDALLNLLEAAG